MKFIQVLGVLVNIFIFVKCQQNSAVIPTTGNTGNTGQVSVNWTHMGTFTLFTVTSPLTSVTSQNNAWLAIGLNSSPQMVCYSYKNIRSSKGCTNTARKLSLSYRSPPPSVSWDKTNNFIKRRKKLISLQSMLNILKIKIKLFLPATIRK